MFRFERRPQTFANHTKIEPAYHFVAFGILIVNLVWSVVQLWRAPGFATALQLALAVALLILFLAVRVFALAVQDRVIRLEMHLRVLSVAPDLSPRFGEFTLNQLCGLRFASDGELPELARKVLTDKLDDRTAIKKMIRDWQPDLARA